MRALRKLLGIKRAQRLIVSERGFDDLKYICRHVLNGIGWYNRIARIRYIPSLAKPLDHHLQLLDEPRSVVLIVHGDSGKLVGGRSENVLKLVDNDWFGGFDQLVDVFAFGCETAGFFEQYRLSRRCTNFVGYAGKIRFFTGSAVSRNAAEELFEAVGRCVARAAVLDESLVAALTQEYTDVMKRLRDTPSRPRDQVRLSLALLEAQIQDLRCFQGGQA